MASRRPLLRSTTLVLTGVAGVVLAHGLDYVLVIPSTGQRAHELAATGHGWWSSAPTAALAAACVAAGLAAAAGATRVVSRRAGGPWPLCAARSDALPVALGQATLFTVLEVCERLGAHRSPVELLHGRLFLTGLLLQVAVAWAAVAMLRLVERTGASVAAEVLRRERRARRRRPALAAVPLALGPGAVATARGEARGPPATAA